MCKVKITIFSLLLFFVSLHACTTLSFHYKNQLIVGHNYDWSDDHSDLVINPKNTIRHAQGLPARAKPLNWHVHYGSVTFDYLRPKHNNVKSAAVVSGMNQAGLVASLFELDQTTFAKTSAHQPNITAIQLIQFWLDQFATVPQALHSLKYINVITAQWAGHGTPVHFILHDANGRHAIVEFLQGKMHIFQGSAQRYAALTNSTYVDARASLLQYQGFGGQQPLPGGDDSQSRYVRAAHYIKALPKLTSAQQAIAYAFAGLQNVAETPLVADPTQWSVVYNTGDKMMYYRTLMQPQIKKINLNKLRFNKQQVVRLGS